LAQKTAAVDGALRVTFHTPRTWQLFGSFYATLRPQKTSEMLGTAVDFPCDSFYCLSSV